MSKVIIVALFAVLGFFFQIIIQQLFQFFRSAYDNFTMWLILFWRASLGQHDRSFLSQAFLTSFKFYNIDSEDFF